MSLLPPAASLSSRAAALTLELIPEADLHVLAQSATPESLAGRVAEGALLPPFAALRALEFLNAGHPPFWANTFYVVRSSDSWVIGGCGFKGAPVQGCVEIGYAVSLVCRNQGVATAAVGALLRLAFEHAEVETVLARILPVNVSSTRVVEKLGFADDGLLPDSDGLLYVQWKLSRPLVRE
jgi:[ribosomal protein S5]-alanine N-acetyltransferase